MIKHRTNAWIRAAGAILMCILLGASFAEAKNRRKSITFSENVMLNETVIERGTYDLKFDSVDSKIMILKDGETVASAKVHIEMGSRRAAYNSASFKMTDKGKIITGITFAGDKRILVIDSSS